MYLENRFSNYDTIEHVYRSYSEKAYETYLTKLEELILQYLPKGAHIFDLCCGRGELVQLLLKKGYQVTGLDGSEVMLRYARENALGAKFILDDARYFKLSPTFHAAVSIGDSLSYVISIEELKNVFHNVYASLLENGFFAFELESEECHQSFINTNYLGDVKDDFAYIERLLYDTKEKLIRESYTQFQMINGAWQRSDLTLQRKAYSSTEIEVALESVGFTEVRSYDEEHDLGVDGAAGRNFFVCRKTLSI
ncbi:class I SAM-dependent methyltransferase [Nostoc sp. ChiQUE01b]|uniref:class I SAM-dependent DNA methyltransferase n=1 Tax=Nostoc sp. ChiQUE01b TaxID=3075376 RepID=UPI002AD5327A|nr:class I SAM-dependent methyltransferase [Nostoc sp. ChiQUE01b]MDZ8257272.1 class I SAM-dependent methyltransferase [Nostoc sp. ChiQUE01b]